jgi:hypothetical protein
MQLFALFLPFIPISALIADKNRRENVGLCYYCNRFFGFFSYFHSGNHSMVTFFYAQVWL